MTHLEIPPSVLGVEHANPIGQSELLWHSGTNGSQAPSTSSKIPVGCVKHARNELIMPGGQLAGQAMSLAAQSSDSIGARHFSPAGQSVST
jgi:hypothetical protein